MAKKSKNQSNKQKNAANRTTAGTGNGGNQRKSNRSKVGRVGFPISPTDGDYVRYVRCLQNPFDNPPVRLGGTTCRTSLITQRTRCVVSMNGILNKQTAGTQTDSMSILFAPFVASSAIYAGWTTAGTGGDYAYVNQTSATVPPSATISAAVTAVRPVGAAIRIRLVASTSNDQGEAVAACLGTGIAVQKTYYGDWINMDEKFVTPARNGIWASWRPQDPGCFIFNEAASQTPGLPPTTAGWSSTDYPVIGIAMTNLSTTSPPTLIVETVLHWECINTPSNNGLLSTGQGTMSTTHQDSVLSGTVLQKMGSAFGDWLKPVYQGMNDVVQTGLVGVGRQVAAAYGNSLVRSAVPLLLP